MTYRLQLDSSLEDLCLQILRLGARVEQQIGLAVNSLTKQDVDSASQVVKEDAQINQLQVNIEEKCMLLIATQQPLARDLRKIVAGFKISIYLERMGDLAVDIAKETLRIGKEELIKQLIDIPRMSELVRQMMVTGLQAYVSEDVEAALAMSELDDQIDHLHSQIFRELLLLMMENPKSISQASYLLFTSRFLERIGDYCTNIAEETEYVVTGQRSDLNR